LDALGPGFFGLILGLGRPVAWFPWQPLGLGA